MTTWRWLLLCSYANNRQSFLRSERDAPLAQSSIQRRDVGPLDVHIDILYFGVCHSDLHQVRNEWHNTIYPCVPGHEIVSRVLNVGRAATKFKEDDLAAVGCMVNSCRTCGSCLAGEERHAGARSGHNGNLQQHSRPARRCKLERML
jgi:uncharacterized zinc-type alcohol dehydrogenase-like protein